MNQNYQYSYGNNEYQPNGYDNQNGSNQYNQPDKSVMSMGDWLITLLALLIPCAGIILYFVWAFGKNENENRKNYCRAYLIYWAITTVLGIIVFIFFGAMIFNMISEADITDIIKMWTGLFSVVLFFRKRKHEIERVVA